MSAVAATSPPVIVWKSPPRALLAWLVAAALLGWFTHDGIRELVWVWTTRPEFSFGAFIPFIVAFLVWQRKELLAAIEFRGSWTGVAILCLGVVVRLAGDLAASWSFVEYGFVIAVLGLALAWAGRPAMRHLWAPLLMLFLMLPLPEVALQGILQRLQLVSSWIGVAIIRACDISVHVEGNLIDLGAMKLQVAEACSGLRYLLSLITLGIIAAYFYRAAFWKRVIVVASAIPITIIMNSVRIGLVGVTVEHFGRSAAEGVLHEFEGMVVFVIALLIMLGEMWVLGRVGGGRTSFGELLAIDLPSPLPAARDAVRYRPIPTPFVACIVVLTGAQVVQWFMPHRPQVKPERQSFAQFPLEFEGWRGRPDKLEKIYLDVLKVDDYLVVDYINAERDAINLHIQYYHAQGREAATHSPRVCIPAGGWEIQRLDQRELPEVPFRGAPLAVNRAIVTRGEATLLVYYWFQQRGRNSTNEMGTKILILWDALTRNRSDGAMVRLITARRPGEALEAADARLTRFAGAMVPRLTPFIPD